jgi:hypothetical protein
MSNLHKSEEGWRRFRLRTGNGAVARRARMDHRVYRKAGPITSTVLAAAEKFVPDEDSFAEAANESRQSRLRGRRRVALIG